jgi:hypothetical protein
MDYGSTSFSPHQSTGYAILAPINRGGEMPFCDTLFVLALSSSLLERFQHKPAVRNKPAEYCHD